MNVAYPPSALFKQWLAVCPRVIGAVSIAAGGVAVGGLAAQLPFLAGQWGANSALDLATALSLLVFGSVLIVLGSGRETSAAKASRLVALLPAVFGVIALVSRAFCAQTIPGAALERAAWPACHVPLLSALGMFLIGVSLALVPSRRLAGVGQVASLVVSFFALLMVVGSVYGVDIREVPRDFNEIGLLEASIFLLLSVGTVCISHDAGIAAVIISDTPGGMAMRRLLPVAVLVPPLMGFVRLWGEKQGHFGPGFGLALFASLNVAVVGTLAAWTAWAMLRLELRRRAATHEALKNDALLKEAQRVAKLGGWELTPATGEVVLSEEAARIFSVASVTGAVAFEQLMQAVHPADRDMVRAAFKSALDDAKPLLTEHRVPLQEGKVVHVQLRAEVVRAAGGKPERLIGTVQDTSERARLQQQLTQAQKMEGIGRLAGGVAHDFNNLLTAILGYTELAMRAVDANSPTYKHMSHVRQAGERSAALTQQLLAFARKTIVEPKVLNLNEVLMGMDKIMRRVIGEDIEIVTVAVRELWAARVDPSQLEQVILNLAVNARDAMPGGGKLTLETGNVVLDSEYCSTRPEVSPGEFVMLAVTDTGTGISDAAKAHLFEPFFTTKERGKGTGLGLATVYGIVKQANGHIGVYSEPGRGTTFKVYLPRTLAKHETRHITDSLDSAVGGKETILLAEDEPLVRSLTSETLRSLGYSVLEAANGADAIRLSAEHDGEIHLLISDVVMPQMSGKKLAEALAKTRPRMAVLFISGYTENAIVHHGVLDAHVQFLPKPFTHTALARKVRDLLDTQGGSRKLKK